MTIKSYFFQVTMLVGGIAKQMTELAKETETLRLVVEVCRHGERASKQIFPLAENPDDNFDIPYNLTMTGAEH